MDTQTQEHTCASYGHTQEHTWACASFSSPVSSPAKEGSEHGAAGQRGLGRAPQIMRARCARTKVDAAAQGRPLAVAGDFVWL
jgi:hypothetical protein